MCDPVIRTRTLVMLLTLALLQATAAGAQDAQPEAPAEAVEAAEAAPAETPAEMPADGPADATTGGDTPGDAGAEDALAQDPEASPGGAVVALRPMKEDDARRVILELMERDTQQEPAREGPAFDGDLIAQEGRPPIDVKKGAELLNTGIKIVETYKDPKKILNVIPQPVDPRGISIEAAEKNIKKAADPINGALTGNKPAPATPSGERHFAQEKGNAWGTGYFGRPDIEIPFTNGPKKVSIPEGVDSGETIHFWIVPDFGGDRIEGRQGGKVWVLDTRMNWNRTK